jgi:hypothetical protein
MARRSGTAPGVARGPCPRRGSGSLIVRPRILTRHHHGQKGRR